MFTDTCDAWRITNLFSSQPLVMRDLNNWSKYYSTTSSLHHTKSFYSSYIVLDGLFCGLSFFPSFSHLVLPCVHTSHRQYTSCASYRLVTQCWALTTTSSALSLFFTINKGIVHIVDIRTSKWRNFASHAGPEEIRSTSTCHIRSHSRINSREWHLQSSSIVVQDSERSRWWCLDSSSGGPLGSNPCRTQALHQE